MKCFPATFVCLSTAAVWSLQCWCQASGEPTAPSVRLDEATQQPVWERASVKLGAFAAAFDSNLGFTVGRAGTPAVSGEDVLGLPSTLTVFQADALYRIGRSRKHQLDFSYAGYHRSGGATLTEPIEIGDKIVIPGARVESLLNFDIFRLGYSYAFLQTSHVRIAGGLSAYVLPIEYGLTVTDGTTPKRLQPRSLTVPVPALALRADFRVWKKLYATSELNGTYLEIAGFRGTLFDADVALEYRFWRHLAVGVGYGGMLVDVLSVDSEPEYPGATSLGQVDVKFHGIVGFVKATF